jgi:hypothetical protein
MQPPRKLYKYYPFNTRTLRLITHNHLYYADPRTFNDPLDCKPTIDVDVETYDLQKLYVKLLEAARPSDNAIERLQRFRYFSENTIDEFGYETDADPAEVFKDLLASEVMILVNEELGAYGVLSLSATWSSSLMWSHYADQHRGICIEYDTVELANPGLFPVQYASRRSIRASDLMAWKFNDDIDAKRRVINTYFYSKAKEWRYEKEWRDVADTSGIHHLNYEITAIYCGLECDDVVIIGKLLSGIDRINIYKVYAPQDRFILKCRDVERGEIEARRIAYPPALDFKDITFPE